MQFSEFKLTPDLLKGIEEAGYAECTEVQQETLAHTLMGKDVFVQSQTGTGKTAAYLISLFELIERGAEREKALVISPTRELAVQIAEEAKLLSLYLDNNIATIFGGVGYASQLRSIAEGIDLLIGTPGRIIDMSNRKMLNLRQFNYAVIDEADRMFDMGFVHDVQTILMRLPSQKARQTMLFSATLSPDVKRLAAGSMNEPVEVHIASENVTVDTINQLVYHVGSDRKVSLLLGILRQNASARALIFVNMKHTAEELTERLRGNGFDAEYLTGDLAQRQRQQRIDRFKNNELPFLIATDVAARGIHVEDLELVVNFDIPMHSENYVHRIGRTARVGKSGQAISLACENFVEFLAPIEQFIKMKIPSSIAEDELYATDATAGRSFRKNRRPAGRDRDRSGRPSSRSSGSNRSSGAGRRPDDRSRSGSGRSTGRKREYERNRSGDGRAQTDNRSGNRPFRETRPRTAPADAGSFAADNRPVRKPAGKPAEGRIPSSHAHDGRSFEKQQHPSVNRHSQKDAPVKKKGLFSKVFSFFR